MGNGKTSYISKSWILAAVTVASPFTTLPWPTMWPGQVELPGAFCPFFEMFTGLPSSAPILGPSLLPQHRASEAKPVIACLDSRQVGSCGVFSTTAKWHQAYYYNSVRSLSVFNDLLALHWAQVYHSDFHDYGFMSSFSAEMSVCQGVLPCFPMNVTPLAASWPSTLLLPWYYEVHYLFIICLPT